MHEDLAEHTRASYGWMSSFGRFRLYSHPHSDHERQTLNDRFRAHTRRLPSREPLQQDTPWNITGRHSGYSHRCHPGNSYYSGRLPGGVTIQGHGTVGWGTAESGYSLGSRGASLPTPPGAARGCRLVRISVGQLGKKKGGNRSRPPYRQPGYQFCIGSVTCHGSYS